MRHIRSEHTANLAMATAGANPVDLHVGKHFDKKVPKRIKNKQGFSFRTLFRIGAIK